MSNVSMVDGHIDEPKMTEEKVIEALEICLRGDYDKIRNALCGKCVYIKYSDCKLSLQSDVLNLIKRIKAERDRYKSENYYMRVELEALNKLRGEQKTLIANLKEVIETIINEQIQLGFEAKTKLEQAKVEAMKE